MQHGNNAPGMRRSGSVAYSSAQRKANEAQQAIVLFIIVLLFFICHTPRFILNIHEFLTLETLRKSIANDCNDISVWALSSASVSHFLMTLNSSINFFIYCFMCSTFRYVVKDVLKFATSVFIPFLFKFYRQVLWKWFVHIVTLSFLGGRASNAGLCRGQRNGSSGGSSPSAGVHPPGKLHFLLGRLHRM